MFKTDFEAERTAREEMVAERDELKETLQQLQLRNQQLLDEMQSMTAMQVSELQRRHGYIAFTQVHTRTHTHTHTLSLSLFLSLSHTHTD